MSNKSILALVASGVLLVSLASGINASSQADSSTEAGSGISQELSTGELEIEKDLTYERVHILTTRENLFDLGFSFGDSVNLDFDNGKSYQDVPYYSGYYTKMGELLLCSYQGDSEVSFTRNNYPFWDEPGLTEENHVVISLNEKGKYLETESANALEYSLKREDYDSDIAFANFRALKGGNIKEETFYRSSSPCNIAFGRAQTVNDLLRSYGIQCCMNLANSEEKYQSLASENTYDYYDSLYQKGDILFAPVKADYYSEGFANAICHALLEMTQKEGPYLVHCDEGKDRTGFVCALLLALSGATQEEIVEDYMITYDNLYGIRKEEQPERYGIMCEKLYEMFGILTGEENTSPSVEELQAGAREYLSYGGLTEEEISRLEEAITK